MTNSVRNAGIMAIYRMYSTVQGAGATSISGNPSTLFVMCHRCRRGA